MNMDGNFDGAMIGSALTHMLDCRALIDKHSKDKLAKWNAYF